MVPEGRTTFDYLLSLGSGGIFTLGLLGITLNAVVPAKSAGPARPEHVYLFFRNVGWIMTDYQRMAAAALGGKSVAF